MVGVSSSMAGGIAGLFAHRLYRVEVDVPGADPADRPGTASADRAGLSALLDDADAAERRQLHPEPAALSTSSARFDALMADLGANTAQLQPRSPVAQSPLAAHPVPSAGPGDLVLVIGLGDDPLVAARWFSTAAGQSPPAVAGRTIGGVQPAIGDRRSAVAARAAGVRAGEPVRVALGLGRSGLDDDAAYLIHLIGADQVWAAVDAGRKAEDTERWVRAVRTAARLDALAVLGTEGTATPDSVLGLGVRIGWIEPVRIG